MKVSDFHYDLPDELIARYPTKQRTQSRLLCLDGMTGAINHSAFSDIVDQLNPGDLLVLNDTKVIPARLFGRKETGGKLEILVERVLSKKEILAHIKASKSPKEQSSIVVDGGYEWSVRGRRGQLFHLRLQSDLDVSQVLEQVGHMPLPPYIDREDEMADQERYQTVYSDKPGAVAAPTAGLHFDEVLLQQIKAKGVRCEFVTLHVGAGTFQPVRVDQVEDHRMHSEVITVTQSLCDKVIATKNAGKRIIAVGTTSVRCLETAAKHAMSQANAADLGADTQPLLSPYQGETDIFIFPGYEFKVVDAMVTNFHLPESTLIMLVSAFAGKAHVFRAYQEAIEQRYRFFSYGDAMYITKGNPV